MSTARVSIHSHLPRLLAKQKTTKKVVKSFPEPRPTKTELVFSKDWVYLIDSIHSTDSFIHSLYLHSDFILLFLIEPFHSYSINRLHRFIKTMVYSRTTLNTVDCQDDCDAFSVDSLQNRVIVASGSSDTTFGDFDLFNRIYGNNASEGKEGYHFDTHMNQKCCVSNSLSFAIREHDHVDSTNKSLSYPLILLLLNHQTTTKHIPPPMT